jgi:hypothetical protein
MNINIVTAIEKYVFISSGKILQFLYRYEAVIILPISRVVPIMMMGQNDAENIAANPVIAYHADTNESVIPVKIANDLSILGFSFI